MPETAGLKRVLFLPLLTLYGLGTTIGAGIFVLIGKIAGVSGPGAPIAFLTASFLAGLSALSFAELSSRYPEAAGEAAYVREGLGSPALALLVGLLVVAAAIVSTSAIIIGFSGYLAEFVPWPPILCRIVIMVLLGALICWGIRETATVAAAITVLEIGVLVAVIVAGIDLAGSGNRSSPTPDTAFTGHLWVGILSGTVLAFYAFMGFEDIVNVAEETEDASRTVPWAIVLTLIVTSLLYVLVAVVAIRAVPISELAASEAPLALIFERASGLTGNVVSAIAIISVLNGALIQTVMASRVLYGLSRRDVLPGWLAYVHPRTGTPIASTVLTVILVAVFAATLPIVRLAEAASLVTLVIFAIVNVALIRIKARGERAPEPPFAVPAFIPVLGLIASLVLLLFGLWQRLSHAI